MNQFIQVYKKTFSDEFCQRVIEYYNYAEQGVRYSCVTWLVGPYFV